MKSLSKNIAVSFSVAAMTLISVGAAADEVQSGLLCQSAGSPMAVMEQINTALNTGDTVGGIKLDSYGPNQWGWIRKPVVISAITYLPIPQRLSGTIQSSDHPFVHDNVNLTTQQSSFTGCVSVNRK